MSELNLLLEESRALLVEQQPLRALEILQEKGEKFQDDVSFLQVYGEVLLENSLLEDAYTILNKACELDSELRLGTEKFFNLGQIIGGEDGLMLLNIGLNRLQEDLTGAEAQSGSSTITGKDLKLLKKKLNQGIFASIEIWMTDLCMNEELELKCDELIKYSLELDAENPELWSTLASIRISQQRVEELQELVIKSWTLFQEKRKNDSNGADDQDDEQDEIIEMIQSLLTLCKYSIELELFDYLIDIANVIQDLNEQSLESYYLESFAHYLGLKKKQNADKGEFKVGEVYPELPLLSLEQPEDRDLLISIRISLTNGLKMSRQLQLEEEDQELIAQMELILNECGGMMKKSELLQLEKEKNENENWEDEIDSE